MDIPARKRALRRATVERILALDRADRRRQESVLIEQFPSLPGYAGAATVLLYATAFPEEIATTPLLEHALAAGKRLVCPRVDRARGMLELCEVQDLRADLVAGIRGIPEPRPQARPVTAETVDWVLVPGLVFDERCYRLGRGAGHYDRLLPALRPGTPCWALAYDCQWTASLPIEPHDVPLDGVVSPARRLTRSDRDRGQV